MSSVALSSSIHHRLDLNWLPIRISSYLYNLPRNFIFFLLESFFRRQLKTFDTYAVALEEAIELSLELEYADAAKILPEVEKLQRRLVRATKRMYADKEEFKGQFANATEYFERLEQVMILLDTLKENLTIMEYLTHDAKFLLGLPDDTRYKVMSFAMDRVRAAMDKNPLAKAEHDEEVNAWLNAPLDPIIEYED
jgi:hypothetical protein